MGPWNPMFRKGGREVGIRQSLRSNLTADRRTRPWRARVARPAQTRLHKALTKLAQKSLRSPLRGCGGFDLPAVGRDLLGGRGVGGVEGVGEGLRVGRAYSGYVVPAHFGVQGGRFVAGRAVKEEAG